MKKVRFWGLDVHAETIAVAVAEADGEVLEDMGKFNEELVKAGVLLAFGELQPSSKASGFDFQAINAP